MPVMTIALDEQQEAKIVKLLLEGQSFRVKGGTIVLEGRKIELETITIEVAKPAKVGTRT